uniref:B30.2/SPRY domain-containing protein n=1 Tax=Globodera pallida TaxID=36090 RepID=A0A183CFA3_GLOPA
MSAAYGYGGYGYGGYGCGGCGGGWNGGYGGWNGGYGGWPGGYGGWNGGYGGWPGGYGGWPGGYGGWGGEEYQKEQQHNQTEICAQIGELKKLVGPIAAGALSEQRQAEADQALQAKHQKLLMDHEALRAEIAEMKRIHKMQEQHQAQMLRGLDELRKAFTGDSVLPESANSFVDSSAEVKEGTEDGTEAVKEGTEDGTEAVKEGTEDGTEAVKEGTEDGTEAVKEGSEYGTEAVKEGTEYGIKAAPNRFNAIETSPMDMEPVQIPFDMEDSTLLNSGHFITSVGTWLGSSGGCEQPRDHEKRRLIQLVLMLHAYKCQQRDCKLPYCAVMKGVSESICKQYTNGTAADQRQALTPHNRWDVAACYKGFTVIEPQRLIVQYDWEFNEYGCRYVFAEWPIPKKSVGIFYFELKFLQNISFDTGYVCIGLAHKQRPFRGILGVCKGAEVIRSTVAPGDVLGVYSAAELFPYASLSTISLKAEANFGPDFLFNIGAGI